VHKFDLNDIRKVQNRSLTSVIYDQLEDMILTGAIKPGERINESKLSAMLKVSRAPIREACRQLEKHGMVQSVARRGTFVNRIEVSEVVELYDIRAALDALATEKAAVQATADDLDGFREMLRHMESAIAANDAKRYFRANIAFHRRIVELSRSANLRSLIDGVYNKASLFRRTNLSFSERMSISFSQHQHIFAAIEAADPETAANRMKHHVIDARDALLKSLELPKKRGDDLEARDILAYR